MIDHGLDHVVANIIIAAFADAIPRLAGPWRIHPNASLFLH